MAAKSVTNITLDISQILMDRENPRHDEMRDQREILNWHVNALADELIQLMRSISNNGLSDIEKILVQPTVGDAFVVKEGNRRLAALKLLNDPSLCDDPLFRRKIESVQVPPSFDYSIDCVCCTDRARVLWMMGLRHLGQQNGVGTYKWGAAEKSRHQQDYEGNARYWRSLYFIDYALKNDLITDQQAVRLSERISNLDRLVPSVEFKNALGVTYKGNIVKVGLEKSIHDKILSILLQKISEPSFNVSKIYQSGDKIKFLTEVLDEAKGLKQPVQSPSPLVDDFPRQQDEPESGDKELGGTNKPAPQSPVDLDDLYPKPKVRKAPSPSDRDTLFIGSISIPPGFSKCSKLYRQVDSLKLSTHGLVVACAARALVDISSRTYVEHFKLEGNGKKNGFNQISLAEMVKLTAENLFSNSRISKELNKVISSGEAANPNSILHPQALHAFMHGRYDNSMSNLKEAWERCYEELLSALWLHLKDDVE
ncbi:TPA: ParB/Srx family N-terminal domain-containing protein [Pseudomonas aeruginosa]